MKPRHRSILGRSILSATALGALAAAGVLTTQATFTDQVTMAQISVVGGTLDLTANGGNGPNQAWSGTISASVTNMQPGDEASGTVLIANAGTLPFTLNTSTTGVDASGCFRYYFRETAVTTGSGAGAHPVNFAGAGTAAGGDGTTAAFTANLSGVALPDNGGDVNWETNDSKTYTMTVRMASSCTTNAASGTLNMTLDATQV